MSLTPTLDDIAEEIGQGKALALAGEYGGQGLYIPMNIHPEHRIVKTIGLSDARNLARRFGGGEIDIPFAAHHNIAKKHHIIREMVAGGMPKSSVAKKLGAWTRSIRRIANSTPRDDDQHKLF